MLFLIISISFIFSEEPNLDMSLGRNNDPRVISDISHFSLWKRKVSWSLLTSPGIRFLTELIYPKTTISHFNVDNAVAFTIDDGFCGVDNLDGDMIEEVRVLFKSHDAKATFFITGSHYNRKFNSDIELLIKDGHELANHNMMDWSYVSYADEEFILDFNKTELILSQYRTKTPKWYRAPFGQFSKTMEEVIHDKNMIHVVCDAFANDTVIPDAKWIAEFILKRVRPGSIVLIHMPEKGVREWNFQALQLTLEGLEKRNLKVVTVSELSKMQKN